MSKEWRPKNWWVDNPKPDHEDGTYEDDWQAGFECGADAMLEVLKKISFPIKGGRIIYAHALGEDMKETDETWSVPLTFPIQNTSSEFKKNGWLVFIPDEANDESKNNT